jgi:hypothetical protein
MNLMFNTICLLLIVKQLKDIIIIFSYKSMITINDITELTDNFIISNISNISYNDFITTTAYSAFSTKELFIEKIKDYTIRYVMMKNIIII